MGWRKARGTLAELRAAAGKSPVDVLPSWTSSTPVASFRFAGAAAGARGDTATEEEDPLLIAIDCYL